MNVRSKYEVYDVSDALSSGEVETLGSKQKAWLTLKIRDKSLHILGKKGRPNSGENWSEKVACELAELLELPHAEYYLADLAENGLCVLSPNFLEHGEGLRLGNELIEGFGREQWFKNTAHTLESIFQTLIDYNVKVPSKTLEQQSILNNAAELFIGYLCLDAWVGNTDRHAENWGIITNPNNINVLAPTFDHASCLGRNESDRKRHERLNTKDEGFNLKAYIRGAKTPIYNKDGQRLNTISVVKECKKHNIQATLYWIEKISKLMRKSDKIQLIFDLVPDEFISEKAKEFAMAMLNENTKQLRELQND
jgi:hypothetical protein